MLINWFSDELNDYQPNPILMEMVLCPVLLSIKQELKYIVRRN